MLFTLTTAKTKMTKRKK